MGKRQHNFVVINGKKYSVDTGEMLQDDTPAREQAVDGPVRIAQQRPADLRKPQKVNKHPNHTDLSVKSTPVKKTQQTDPLSHKAKIATTKARPKSLKVQKPATDVHAKARVQQTAPERAKQPHTPKVSNVSMQNIRQASSATSKPKIALGTSQHEARRLRAAQHRKHEQISKFAKARRSVDQLQQSHAEVPVPKPDPAPVEQRPQLPPRQTVQAAKVETKTAIAQHHLRQEQTQQDTETTSEQEPKQSFFKSFNLKQNFLPAAAASLSVLLVVGYITYLNIPNFAMRIAASRAGFEASMPAYTPDGFSFDGPIAYNSGQVIVDFTSNTDDREYKVAQRQSRWDSQSLLENVVKEEDDTYLTFEDKGLTIYVYNDSTATWVNRGIWYTIDGDSKLSNEQILKIATSL